jgi:hypothetical protein
MLGFQTLAEVLRSPVQLKLRSLPAVELEMLAAMLVWQRKLAICSHLSALAFCLSRNISFD